MDGGSTDETLDVLRIYNDPRLQWLSEPDNGQSHAINKGMRLAKGELIAYLNSDDIYLPGTLSFVAEFLGQHPDVDIVHGNCITIDGDGNTLNAVLIGNAYTLRSAFTNRWHIPQPAAFWRRCVLERIGLFDESLHYAMDYDYWLRMLVAGFKPHYVDEDLAGFRVHGDNKSVNLIMRTRYWEDWQIILNKIYSAPDLSPEIARLRPMSYAYIDFNGAEAAWELGERKQARPFLRRILTGGGPLRLKVLAATLYFDSALGTSVNRLLRKIYVSMK